MTTTSSIDPSHAETHRPRFAAILEVVMVVVGLATGAAFYSSIWSEPVNRSLQAVLGPHAATHRGVHS
jgi:hypothetical protein